MSQSEARYDVFICYRSEDREEVRFLFAELTKRGLNPYWDQLLKPGEDWLTVLARRLETCRPFILCLGPGDLTDQQEDELRLALTETRRHRFFPVLLPNGSIPEENYLWHRLRWYQVTDLSGGMNQQAVLYWLAEEIRQHQGDPLEGELSQEGESSVDTKAVAPPIEAPPTQIVPPPQVAQLERLGEGNLSRDRMKEKQAQVLAAEYSRRLQSEKKREKLLVIALVTLALVVIGVFLYPLLLRVPKAKGSRLDVALLSSLEAGSVRKTIEARSGLLTLLQESRYLKFILSGDKEKVYSAAFDPTGRWIASGGGSKLYLWEIGDAVRLAREIDLSDDTPITSIAFSPKENIIFLSKAGEPRIRRYSMDGSPLPPLEVLESTEGIHNLTFSPLGGRLLAFSAKNQIFLWDEEKQKPHALAKHEGFVSKLAFSPDGTVLASAGLDKAVGLWRIPSGERIEIPVHPGTKLNGVAFNPVYGNILAISGTMIELWDVEARKPLGPPLQDGASDDLVLTVAFSPDGKTIASAGTDTDRKIRLWTFPPAADRKPFSYLSGHREFVWSLAFSRDGQLLSGGEGGEVMLWDTSLPPPLSRVAAKSLEGFSSFAVDPLGKILILGESGGGVTLREITSGASVILQSPHKSPVESLAADRGAHVLVSGDEAGKLFLWRDKACLGEIVLPSLPSDPDPVEKLALTPDGKWGAAATKNGRVFSLDIERKHATALVLAKAAVSALAIDPGHTRLAFAENQRLSLWDLRRSRMVAIQDKAHDENISALAFSTRGLLLAAGSVDGTVRLWQAGEALTQQGDDITGLERGALAWSQDGKMLAAGGIVDGKIALWDVATHQLITPGLIGPAERVSGLAFSEDGHLISLSEGQALEWQVQYGAWRAYACSLLQGAKFLAVDKYRHVCGR